MTLEMDSCEPSSLDIAPSAVRNRLGMLLYKTGHGLLGYCEDDLGKLGLDGREYTALAILDEDLPRSQLELAQLTGKAPAIVVGMVDALEEQGFAVRERDPADRRRSLVRITDKGRAALAKADALAAEAEQAILGGLDAQERAQLHALLQRALAPALEAAQAAAATDAEVPAPA